MKTTINTSDFETNVLKAIRENHEELAIRVIDEIRDIINNEANKYERLAYSTEGRTIRYQSTGTKFFTMSEKAGNLIRKANLLWSITGKLYEMETKIMKEGLTNF